jgi:hypothetical protein
MEALHEGGRTMKPEAQRIAIAVACGWEIYEKLSDIKGHDKHTKPHLFPSYLSDLNAMHVAEKVLKEHGSVCDETGAIYHSQRSRYVVELWCVVTNQIRASFNWPSLGLDATLLDVLVSATAAQRAEAFLKTLNLWKQ